MTAFHSIAVPHEDILAGRARVRDEWTKPPSRAQCEIWMPNPLIEEIVSRARGLFSGTWLQVICRRGS